MAQTSVPLTWKTPQWSSCKPHFTPQRIVGNVGTRSQPVAFSSKRHMDRNAVKAEADPWRQKSGGEETEWRLPEGSYLSGHILHLAPQRQELDAFKHQRQRHKKYRSCWVISFFKELLFEVVAATCQSSARARALLSLLWFRWEFTAPSYRKEILRDMIMLNHRSQSLLSFRNQIPEILDGDTKNK